MTKREGESDRRKHDVQLYHPQFSQPAPGKLNFGGNRWAQVTFSGSLPAVLTDGSQLDVVKAVTEEGTSFSLCVCKIIGGALHVDYVC